ncbi:DUF4194 domain-containing protein [Cupriavidus gilardii]|uniref:DUF4194 domain-containing protein n=1 Tax=Cupriavidus gilardii TaxID=82541 RepID=A0ABY4VML6_9BURK|nr:DUF4194 domain-containing protein [Cupriavidus gilardii]USE77279.1 DUF4194 domain-containing protein [Cupriavidus gilardii]
MTSIFDVITSQERREELSNALHQQSSTLLASVPVADEQPNQSVTPAQIKETCQELLKYGLLEAAKKPNLYRNATIHIAEIDRILEPLDLALKIDDVRGLAFLVTAQPLFLEHEEEWSHPLVRRQRLTLEQSLLVALLRQHYVVHEQERGIGAVDAQVALEDLLPQIQMYLGNLGSEARELQRLRMLLEKLKPHGIVSEVDPHDQVLIRPIIVHLANPQTLHGLLQAFRRLSQSKRGESDEHGERNPDNDPEETE